MDIISGKLTGQSLPEAGVEVAGTIRKAGFERIGILVSKSFGCSGFLDYRLTFNVIRDGEPDGPEQTLTLVVIGLRARDRGRAFIMDYREVITEVTSDASS